MHVVPHDTLNFIASDINITVDVEGQRNMLSAHNLLSPVGVPMFPFNTDGFDPSGRNVLIERIFVQNFDDVVAVKPMHKGGGILTDCSQNMTIRNAEVKLGVGMTIGSVPPHTGTACVRDILFENVSFETPFKAVYIKTNPGTEGDGVIDNIRYRNLTIKDATWYPIWIGPQQQHQPFSKGTGCSFEYPVVDVCPTQPRINVSNIFLEDVHATGGLLLPGVILCNSTNPCSNISLDNVVNNGEFEIDSNYVCKFARGSTSGSTLPVPGCF